MRKGGISSAPATPRGGIHGRGGQPTQLTEEHYLVTTTFVQADVSTFREVVQKLTGGPPSPLPRSLAAGSPDTLGSVSNDPPPVPLRQDSMLAGRPELDRIMSIKPVGGPGPQRKSTAKLLERRQHARKLELKQLMGPHILKRMISPALSPVSPLTGVDVFAEQDAVSCPIGSVITSASSVTPPPTPRPAFDLERPPQPSFDLEQPPVNSSTEFFLNRGVVRLDLDRSVPSPREPRLLPLFPLHSPRSLNS